MIYQSFNNLFLGDQSRTTHNHFCKLFCACSICSPLKHEGEYFMHSKDCDLKRVDHQENI